MATALYRWFSTDDELLYVGVSNNPFTRFSQHRVGQIREISRIEIEWFDEREDAKQAEAFAINIDQPIYNEKMEVLNFYEWMLHAHANKCIPFDEERSVESREHIIKNIKKGCIARGWLQMKKRND